MSPHDDIQTQMESPAHLMSATKRPIQLLDLPHEIQLQIWQALFASQCDAWGDFRIWNGRRLEELLSYLTLCKSLTDVILEARCARVNLCNSEGAAEEQEDGVSGEGLARWLLRSRFQPTRYIRTIDFDLDLEPEPATFQRRDQLLEVAASCTRLSNVNATFYGLWSWPEAPGILDSLQVLPIRALFAFGDRGPPHPDLLPAVSRFDLRALGLEDLSWESAGPLPVFRNLQTLDLNEAYLPLGASFFQASPQLTSFRFSCRDPESYKQVLLDLPSSLRELWAQGPDSAESAQLCFAKIRTLEGLRSFHWRSPLKGTPAAFESLLASLPSRLCHVWLTVAGSDFTALASVLVQRLADKSRWLPALRDLGILAFPQRGPGPFPAFNVSALQAACDARGIELDFISL